MAYLSQQSPVKMHANVRWLAADFTCEFNDHRYCSHHALPPSYLCKCLTLHERCWPAHTELRPVSMIHLVESAFFASMFVTYALWCCSLHAYGCVQLLWANARRGPPSLAGAAPRCYKRSLIKCIPGDCFAYGCVTLLMFRVCQTLHALVCGPAGRHARCHRHTTGVWPSSGCIMTPSALDAALCHAACLCWVCNDGWCNAACLC
ncbi:hypothetical protein COO60DRAFT_308975 [Scenedesmus sp. NREL 46B-D3]|nr:hypothetical protein COO60DRAFT_308975 [Scenedesmus sp. NREL 46B-D3]